MKKIILGIVGGILVGSIGTYAYMNYDIVKREARSSVRNLEKGSENKESLSPEISQKDIPRKRLDRFFDDTFDNDFFDPHFSPFKQMEKMRENMDKLFEQHFGGRDHSQLFDSWFNDKYGGSVFDIEQEEDDKHVYYKIRLEGVDQNNLKIEVEDGMLNISGDIVETREEASRGTISKSNFRQHFYRSFPVPANVDADKVQFETKEDIIIVKFPKSGIKI